MEGLILLMICTNVLSTTPGTVDQITMVKEARKIWIRGAPTWTPSTWKFVFRFNDGTSGEVTERSDFINLSRWHVGDRVTKTVTPCGNEIRKAN